MTARQPATRNRVGNGKTAAENQVYARIARSGMTRDQELRSAEAARKGRRDAAARRITAVNGPLPGDVFERLIDRDISAQMDRARAKALTARRHAREAAEQEAAAVAGLAAARLENLDLDASQLLDAGEA